MEHQRMPNRAVALSLLTPGLGHLYCGMAKSAIRSYMLVLAAGALSFFLLFWAPIGRWSLVLAALAVLASIFWVAFDALRTARLTPIEYSLQTYNRRYVYVGLIVVNLLFAETLTAAVRSQLGRSFMVMSDSMEPALLIGDCVFVSTLRESPADLDHGSLVLFESPEDPSLTIMKRLVGNAGDTLEMRNDSLYRNGRFVQENHVRHVDPSVKMDSELRAEVLRWQVPHLVGSAASNPLYLPGLRDWGPIAVPDGSLFALGDQRDASYDSRFYGFVSWDLVFGQPSVIYYSYDPNHWRPLPVLTAIRWARIGFRF